MTQAKRFRIVRMFLDTMGWPLAIGLAATVGFYAAVEQGIITNSLLIRYTAGHPVEYVEVAMFFAALAALGQRLWHTSRQLAIQEQVTLSPSSVDDPTSKVDELLDQLDSLPSAPRRSTLAERIRNALAHIQRTGSPGHLEDELKYLADVDSERMHDAYSLVRMIVWATPMLGFLGTVIGITLALGDLSPEMLVNSPKVAMEGLLSGLSVAFDTTALALTLSIILMFGQFLSVQIEMQHLSVVDRRVHELIGRQFQSSSVHRDPGVAAVTQATKSIVGSMEDLTKSQLELWEQTLDEAHVRWNQVIEQTGTSVQSVVSGALEQGLQTHSQRLAQLEEASQKRNAASNQQMADTIAAAAKNFEKQQEQLSGQTRLLHKVLDATGQIAGLETTLNENLRALAGAKNFEDTVMSLSAAIHLLSSRIGRPVGQATNVRLEEPNSQERAA